MRYAIVILFAAAAALFSPEAAVADGDLPDLNGRWVLNQDASDNPMEAMRGDGGGRGGDGPGGGGGHSGGGPGGGGGRSGGGPGGGGRGGRGGMEDGQQSRGESPEAKAHMEKTMQRLGALTIFQEGPELDFTDGLDISRLLYTDGRECTVWTDQGQQKAVAVWQDRALVITWNTDRGERTTRLELADDGARLVRLEQLRGGGDGAAKTLRLVYDRAPTGSDS